MTNELLLGSRYPLSLPCRESEHLFIVSKELIPFVDDNMDKCHSTYNCVLTWPQKLAHTTMYTLGHRTWLLKYYKNSVTEAGP